MIYRELRRILDEERLKGSLNGYIRNALKEYLQAYVLYFVYTHPHYRQNLIFTGGTCLRHFYGLERLSEDLDFDCITACDTARLLADVKSFFSTKYKYTAISGATRQGGRQLLLKFPVLKDLGLASAGDSDLLYVKVDLSPIPSKNYSSITNSKNSFGMNYAARHYDLPSLMSGKLHAILSRRYLSGSQESIKGRDYFDLLWFVKEGVRPNILRLSDMLGKAVSLAEVGEDVDAKVAAFIQRHRGDFESDMTPLVSDPAMIMSYIENYEEEYLRFRNRSFLDTITLNLVCNKCGKKFAAGISLERHVFETIQLSGNKHQCPFCKHMNEVTKEDYLE